MSNLNQVKPSRKERRATKAYQKKRARLYRKIGSELTETEKQYEDRVDFSIFNMVLERIPFQGYKDTMDVLRAFYRGLYPFMRKMLVDTIYFRDLLHDERFREVIEERMTSEELEQLEEVMKSPSNPFDECKAILDKIRKEALKGAKNSNIIKPKSKIIT